jgi:hypothetical protein
MDFSHAGYMGGGVAIPTVPVKRTVKPSGGDDDSAVIQAAIDEVSALPLVGGFRGAVLLAPGVYRCPTGISVSASGVVLRGSGSEPGKKRTTLQLTGKPHMALTVRAGGADKRGAPREPEAAGAESALTDAYVPSGATSFTVADAKGFAPGDTVVDPPAGHRGVGEAHADGRHEPHRKPPDVDPHRHHPQHRADHQVDRGQQDHAGGPADRLLRLEVPEPARRHLDEDPGARAREPGRRRAAAHRVAAAGDQPLAAALHGAALSRRGRLGARRRHRRDHEQRRHRRQAHHLPARVRHRKAKHQGASKPAEFAPNGTQILLDRCSVTADNVWFVATGGGQAGPNVILNSTFQGSARAESHQRWSTGILYDNCRAPDGGIELRNRGSMGSGHGWSMGWGVVWNCEAKDYIIQNPPGAVNWMIGNLGESKQSPRPFGSGPLLPEGTKDSPGKHVTPESLYLTQLAERLGPRALRNLGYPPSARRAPRR